jgi:hypothetical protein
MSLVMITIRWWSVAPIALQNSLQLTQLVVIGRQLAESKRKLPFQILPIGQEDSPPQNSPNSAEESIDRVVLHDLNGKTVRTYTPPSPGSWEVARIHAWA